MAVFTKFDNNLPVNNARAVIQGPPALPLFHDVATNPWASGDDVRFAADAAVLDGRYKTGGSTTWERPAKSG